MLAEKAFNVLAKTYCNMNRVILLLSILLMGFASIAQKPFRLSFNHITRENGLSNNNVMNMYRDSKGFLWLASINGLNRFDGLNCKIYTPENSGIVGTNIFSIVETKEGNLFVGTETGLSFYNREKDTFQSIHFGSALKVFSAFPYTVDHEGLLWVVIKSNLFTYNAEKKKFTFITNQISSQLSLYQQPKFSPIKTIYCGGANDFGLRKLTFIENKLVKTELFFDGTKANQPVFPNIKEHILVENDSTIWITGNQLGLVRLNPKNGEFEVFNQLNNKIISPFSRMVSYKNFLIMGSTRGLFIFDKTTVKFVQHIQTNPFDSNSQMSNYSEMLYTDGLDNLFLSQLGFGIDYCNFNSVLVENWIGKETALATNDIGSLIANGNESFIRYAEGQGNATFIIDESGKIKGKLSNMSVLLVDSEKRIWTTDETYFYILDQAKKPIRKFKLNELKDQKGWQISMVELHKGVYIIATSKGIYEYNEVSNNLLPIPEFNAEKVISILPILYDKSSEQLFISANWWSVFYVLKKQENKWTITKKLNLRVYSIRKSNNPNKVWLGTNLGLAIFDKHDLSYKLLDEKDSLPDKIVTDIVEESNGDYWLVTNRGISYFNKKLNSFRNFSSRDGVKAHEFGWNNAFKLSDGRTIFSSTNGLFVFNKSFAKQSSVVPKIHILDFYVNEKPLPVFKNTDENSIIHLKPTENSFALDLIGIDQGFWHNMTITYKLEGQDDKWISTKNGTTVRYSNLREGKYVFKVKAIDMDSQLSSPTKTMYIVVNPPFYRSLWFRILIILAMAACSYLFLKFREKRIREETENNLLKEKNKIIENTLEKLKNTQDQLIQKEKLASLGELTAGIAHEIQNPLNFVNNFAELSIDLIKEIKDERQKIQIEGSSEASEGIINEILEDLEKNQEKINHHGKRASNIVSGMLEHSNAGTGERVLTNINLLAEEYLRLSYRSMQLKDKSLKADFMSEYEENIPKVNVVPQDIGRVLLNVINNAVYAISVKAKVTQDPNYKPTIVLKTQKVNNMIQTSVKDNGIGIPENIKSKILQPFFTTKPTGEGTGLGLSLSNDIITKGHNGSLEITSEPNQGTTVFIKIPIKMD